MERKSAFDKKEIEEAVVLEQIDENKVLVDRARKIKIGVINPRFASELAYHIAKFTTAKVLLIDGDAMMPTIAENLGIKEVVNNRVDFGSSAESSFKMAMDYMATSKPSGDILKSIAIEHPRNKNLMILTGDNDLYNFETYSDEAFKALIRLSYEAFDMVVVNVRYEPYDGFYNIVGDWADFMLYGINAYADEIFSFNRIMRFLKSLEWSIDNHYVVPFDYNETRQLSANDINYMVDKQMLTPISGDKNRQFFRNDFRKNYAFNMSKKNVKEYHKLAKTFGFTTKKKLFGR